MHFNSALTDRVISVNFEILYLESCICRCRNWVSGILRHNGNFMICDLHQIVLGG